MKQTQVEYRQGFKVLGGNERSQSAVMVLAQGETTGGPNNEHPDSDQWLYVLSGTGKATVRSQTVDLNPGSLLLIEKGETHEVTNTGDKPLNTINFYVPPAY